MHRVPLLQLLAAYEPASSYEAEAKKRMIQFIEEQPACFERSLEIGHITASAWLIDKTGSHALLTHHSKLDRWLQLGGHCDGDADVLYVAIKEAQEESGIVCIEPVSQAIFDIDIHLIPAYKDTRKHYHYDVRFLLQVTSDEELVISSESKALRWISQDKAALPTSEPSIVRMFTKWVRYSKILQLQGE